VVDGEVDGEALAAVLEEVLFDELPHAPSRRAATTRTRTAAAGLLLWVSM
jgi:hypothetical protein